MISPSIRRIARLTLIAVWGARAASAERLPFKMYSSADGLASDAVNRIVQDSRGFLWIGTDDGVSRFDGYEFKNLGTREGLPHPVVNDVLEARDGSIWLATGAGVCQVRASASVPSAPIANTRSSSPHDARCLVYAPSLAAQFASATVLLQDRGRRLEVGALRQISTGETLCRGRLSRPTGGLTVNVYSLYSPPYHEGCGTSQTTQGTGDDASWTG